MHQAVANPFGVKQTVCSPFTRCTTQLPPRFPGPVLHRAERVKNLMCAKSDDNLIDVVSEGLAELCRQKVTGCVRELVMKDSHEALNMSDLKRNRVTKELIRP